MKTFLKNRTEMLNKILMLTTLRNSDPYSKLFYGGL